MKRHGFGPLLPLLVALGIGCAFTGCDKLGLGKKEDESQQEIGKPKPPSKKREAPPIRPLKLTSFADVAARLDTGGSMFTYVGTRQWITNFTRQVKLVGKYLTQSIQHPDERKQFAWFFQMIERVQARSGFRDVRGIGRSSFALEGGLFRSQTFLHRDVAGTGFAWSLVPKADRPTPGLALLPSHTIFAAYGKFDLLKAWNILMAEIETDGSEQMQQDLKKLLDDLRDDFGVDLEQFFGSQTDGMGFLLTRHPQDEVKLKKPMLNPQAQNAPRIRTAGEMRNVRRILTRIKRFDAAWLMGTTDSSIYDAITAKHAANTKYRQLDEGSLRMIEMDLVTDEDRDWRWTFGYDGEHFMVGTGPDILKAIVSTKVGAGLTDEPALKDLATHASEDAAAFTYAGPEFQAFSVDLNTYLMSSGVTNGAVLTRSLVNFLHSGDRSFATMRALDDGWLWTRIGASEPTTDLLKVGLIKPVRFYVDAIWPSIQAERAQGLRTDCLNNQKKIDEAKRKWAEAGGFSESTIPATRNIERVLGSIPSCPEGGRYTIGRVGAPCKCSHGGHAAERDGK